MADENLLRKIHRLGDIDLAALLCLVAREHCIISTEPDALDELVEELELVASRTFNLPSVVVDCTPQTTLDDFAVSILLPTQGSPTTPRSVSPLNQRGHQNASDSYFPSSQARRTPSPFFHGSSSRLGGSSSSIAPIVLAKNLDAAPRAVQIQALELLRTRRLFTRTSVVTAPKTFLFVAVIGAGSGGEAGANGGAKEHQGKSLTRHLNDFFYVSHWADPEDGFPHLDGNEHSRDQEGKAQQETDGETASLASDRSVVRGNGSLYPTEKKILRLSSGYGKDAVGNDDRSFTEGDISTLSATTRQVNVDVEVLRYQMNIISFLRMHRAVGGGINPTATKHFDQLVKSMAVFHGLDFVTPGLVALAAKKIYVHRIRIVSPDRERSMQWGSELEAVKIILDGVEPEDIIEDVLGMVAAPL